MTAGGPVIIEDVVLRGPGCLVANETAAGHALLVRRVEVSGTAAGCSYAVSINGAVPGALAPAIEDVTVHDTTTPAMRAI